MPWELDYALLTFTQLKKSKYYLDNKDTIEIHPVLNLSSYLVDWDKSQLPKQLLIDRFNQYLKLLKDYKVTAEIHEGDYLYGHLDHQRETISSEVDFYISICPDMYFSEHLLPLLISSSKQVDTKYFLITPEIYKMWDNTWDEITNYDYLNVPYDEWDKGDIFDIRANTKSSNKNVTLETTTKSKWAGWFDLYNKAFYEELCPIHNDWKGYGPWDFYSLLLTEYIKTQGIDFQQYLLEGQTIFEYSVGPLKDWNNYYKENNLLKIKDVPNQREIFEGNMQLYLNKGIELLKNKKVL